jgi:hypothetical protein
VDNTVSIIYYNREIVLKINCSTKFCHNVDLPRSHTTEIILYTIHSLIFKALGLNKDFGMHPKCAVGADSCLNSSSVASYT